MTEVDGLFAVSSMCSDRGHERGKYEESFEGQSDQRSDVKLNLQIFEINSRQANIGPRLSSKFGLASLRRSRLMVSRIAFPGKHTPY